MTDRQRTFWLQKFKVDEQRMLDFYRKNPSTRPDGSFFMGAFLQGRFVVQREVKKRTKK